jgi:SAM-dependent methyltransferase
VLALVAHDLKANGWDGVPPRVVETLVRYRSGLTARNLFLTRQLIDVLATLEGAGIDALPYKGPALAVAAYGDLGLRPFADLDIVVSERHALAAKALLESEGYRSLIPRTDSERAGRLPRDAYAFPLRSADGRVLVEVHWKLSHSLNLTLEDLLVGVEPLPLLGSTVRGLGAEQLLLVLCVHGTKHAWDRLEWTCSVAHLIRRCPGLDWERVTSQARSFGALRSLALGLVLATRLSGAVVPTPVLTAVGAGAVAAVARDIEADLFADGPVSGRYARRFRTRSLSDQVRYLLFLRHPTERDRVFLDLPSGLSGLYVVVRPLRVIHERVVADRWRRWVDGARRAQAQRALVRQLASQERKARALAGREEQMAGIMSERWQRVRHRLERQQPGCTASRLVEVGSGAHGLVFGRRDGPAVGVDPLAAHYATLFPAWQRSVPTVAAAGEHLPFGDGTFGVVLCDNVVDHAERPEAIVAEMARILAPGGLLYFTVNVHHRLYGLVSSAHRAWNAAGIPLEIKPFADHTVHFSPAQARALLDGGPLRIRWDQTHLAEARERARRRPLWSLRDLPARLFFKNARFETIAERVG